jgi:hypothetical protein
MTKIVLPTGRAQTITPANDGDMFILGNTSNESDVGGWKIHLMPDEGGVWAGAIYILRRPEGKMPFDNGVGFSQSPYRRIVINNLAADCALDSAPLTGVSEIQVEANGTSIAFMVQCSAGSATVYSRPLQGSVAF